MNMMHCVVHENVMGCVHEWSEKRKIIAYMASFKRGGTKNFPGTPAGLEAAKDAVRHPSARRKK